MILLEDITTYPAELSELVLPKLHQLNMEREFEREYQLQGKSWFATVGESASFHTKHQVIALLKDYSVMAYHATRVIDFESILETGLLPLERDKWLSHAREGLQTNLNSTSLDKAQALIETYVQEEDFKGRQGNLWFYLTEQQAFCNENKDLLEFFGGRVLRNALYDRRFEYYPVLKHIGVPTFFSCQLTLADVTDEQVEMLAGQLINHFLNKELNISPTPITGEVSVRKPVAPEGIEVVIKK